MAAYSGVGSMAHERLERRGESGFGDTVGDAIEAAIEGIGEVRVVGHEAAQDPEPLGEQRRVDVAGSADHPVRQPRGCVGAFP